MRAPGGNVPFDDASTEATAAVSASIDPTLSYSVEITTHDNNKMTRLITSQPYQHLWGSRFQMTKTERRLESDQTGFKIASPVDAAAPRVGQTLPLLGRLEKSASPRRKVQCLRAIQRPAVGLQNVVGNGQKRPKTP